MAAPLSTAWFKSWRSGAVPFKSILFSISIRFRPAGSWARMSRVAAFSPSAGSTSTSATSASSAARRLRPMPICSTTSSVSRKPAVSTMCTGTPSSAICSRTVSRVVPAMSVTIATSSPASALSRLDLPTLGAPTSTTVMPSRSRLPCRADARTASTCRCSAASRPRASAASRKSMSSSGKSSVASTSIRNVINSSTSAWMCRENSPLSERSAILAALWLDASIKSATLSACARSSLLLRNARLVNSPGSAARAPNSKQRESSICITTGPPCPCSSITSSPVKLAGAGKYSSRPLSIGVPSAAVKSV